MLFKLTERGFERYEFVDRYGADCSLQASSLATEFCIWLGYDHEIVDDQGRLCCTRMHLTQDMAARLWPLLKHFAESGEVLRSQTRTDMTPTSSPQRAQETAPEFYDIAATITDDPELQREIASALAETRRAAMDYIISAFEENGMMACAVLARKVADRSAASQTSPKPKE